MTARSIPCFFMLFAFATLGESQTWHPLPNAYKSDRFDYRIDTFSIPQFPVYADTVAIVAGDSTWVLHQYPLPCRTCSIPGMLHYPGISPFMGHSIRHEEAVGYWLTSDSLELLLETTSEPGVAWPFSNTLGWTAWVDAAYDTLLWGSYLDSVKRIQISTGDTLLLSKHYGILRYPFSFGEGDSTPYRLSGIQGRKHGRYIPDWRDMLDMEIGMLLQYRFYQFGFSSDTRGVYVVRVIDIEETDSTKTVHLKGSAKGHYEAYFPTTPSYSSKCKVHGEIEITENSMSIGLSAGFNRACNGSASFYQNMDLQILEWYMDEGFFGGASNLQILRPRKGPNGRIQTSNCPTTFESSFNCDGLYTAFEVMADASTPSGYVAQLNGFPDLQSSNMISWTEGLGFTGYHGEGIDNGNAMTLTAYRMADESWGTFEDTLMWPLNGLNEVPILTTLDAFPNPSNGYVHVPDWTTTGSVTVLNAIGQTVVSIPFQSGMPIDLSALPNGLYWIELQNKDQRGLAKIALQRP